ncbi:MAG: prenyltransferase/squalene oxidase repeat-containing protein [Myxococcota bacterium]
MTAPRTNTVARDAISPERPLDRGVDALLSLQRADGSWEGECVWNPMLAAQYVIAGYVMKLEISGDRRRGLLKQFESTRQSSGLWGLHPFDDGTLFVTTLVYVAARLLGAPKDTPWLAEAQRLFSRERVESIPTWGKVWLALLGLYEWAGINPILPEVWALPKALPVHPANYYCHTRAIYLGLAVLYGERIVADDSPKLDALRTELYADRFDAIDFVRCANDVRAADAPFQATLPLRALFSIMRVYDRVHARGFRRSVLSRLRDDMRAHLRASDYLSLSPVNGLLGMVALWHANEEDPDLRAAVARFDAWFWEDDQEGSRVAGAGSVCWDTAFALQALMELPEASQSEEVTHGVDFLLSQQVRFAGFEHEAAFRIDPTGGWCFSEMGHRWPVSDCTAEALIAILETRPEMLGEDDAVRAVRFMLRCQNYDGGFGSYEPSKTRVPLEWMNPSEMFGRCMTERSYVECTGSCLIALCAVKQRYPALLPNLVSAAIDRAREFLCRAQNPDGTWSAAWGVHYLYATMFGVRGLLAAGVPATDAHVRDACHWLLEHQRGDGAWGEHYQSGAEGHYVHSQRASAVQTAWALIALIEADEPNDRAVARGVEALEAMQTPDGEWPDEEYVGVFFETALLNYRFYRLYFPVTALALHRGSAQRRIERRPS